MTNTAVVLIEEGRIGEVKEAYAPYLDETFSDYTIFSAGKGELRISCYQKADAQARHKLVFQGPGAEKEARRWGEILPRKEKTTPKKKKLPFKDQIGSDEVGTGDFFGPICVAAAYVRKENLPRLLELGVTDSKKIDDEKIRELGPILIKEFDYSSLALDNAKFNEVIRLGINMNAIKSILHNRALGNLHKRHPDAEIDIDQFAEEKTYYRYLKNEAEITRINNFSIKGEEVFPSVALASCLARYNFLLKMDSLGKKYGMEFPFGASPRVDEFAREFIKRHGEKELENVCKTNFKNYQALFELV